MAVILFVLLLALVLGGLGFALHVLFAQMTPLSWLGLRLELPVVSSLNIPSALLTAAAAVAAFRFRIGMIPLLLICSGVGVAWVLITGHAPARS